MMGIEFNERSHRYRLDGKPVKGVTTLLNGGVPKGDALIWWAVKHTAYRAHSLRGYLPEDRDATYDLLKRAWIEDRDAAAVTGTAVHSLAEALVTTGELDDAVLERVLATMARAHKDTGTPFDLAEAEGLVMSYVTGFLDFMDEWDVTPILSEMFVGSRAGQYCGRLDLIATSPLLGGGPVMIDLKTSGSVYPETALQNAAYARAEFYQDEPGGPELLLPDVQRTYVAHVTPTRQDTDPEDHTERAGRYKGKPYGTTLYQLAGSPDEIAHHHELFLAAATVARRKLTITEAIKETPS